MSVSETPTHTESGEERPVDDWQPRANITKLFNMGSISLEHEETITEFAERFYVKKEYVVTYIQHLTNLQHGKEIRSRQRAKEKSQSRTR